MYLNEVVRLYHVIRSAALVASTALVVATTPSAVLVEATATTELERLMPQLRPAPSNPDAAEAATVQTSVQARPHLYQTATVGRDFTSPQTKPTSTRPDQRRATRAQLSRYRTTPELTKTPVDPTPMATTPVAPAPGVNPPPADEARARAGAVALGFAYAQIGKPYRYAAVGPNSFDCSGLTMAAWRSAGIRLPHSAASQYHTVRRIGRGQLRAGDLVFFYQGVSHVGIYAGNGKVIDAPQPGQRVALRAMSTMPIVGFGRP